MKQRIDLEKASEGEAFGALAVGSKRKHRANIISAGQEFTPAQNRALSKVVRSLVKVAKESGAEHKRVTVGKISFDLKENGSEEILSIRTVR